MHIAKQQHSSSKSSNQIYSNYYARSVSITFRYLLWLSYGSWLIFTSASLAITEQTGFSASARQHLCLWHSSFLNLGSRIVVSLDYLMQRAKIHASSSKIMQLMPVFTAGKGWMAASIITQMTNQKNSSSQDRWRWPQLWWEPRLGCSICSLLASDIILQSGFWCRLFSALRLSRKHCSSNSLMMICAVMVDVLLEGVQGWSSVLVFSGLFQQSWLVVSLYLNLKCVHYKYLSNIRSFYTTGVVKQAKDERSWNIWHKRVDF